MKIKRFINTGYHKRSCDPSEGELTLLQSRTDDLNDEQFDLLLQKIQEIGNKYNQDRAKRFPNPLVHGHGPWHEMEIPDGDWQWSLDIQLWDLKDIRKLMKFVKTMKPKNFHKKTCPIQVKTDRCIFTGALGPLPTPTTIKRKTLPLNYTLDDCAQQ